MLIGKFNFKTNNYGNIKDNIYCNSMYIYNQFLWAIIMSLLTLWCRHKDFRIIAITKRTYIKQCVKCGKQWSECKDFIKE